MSSHSATLQKSFPGPRLAGFAFVAAPLLMLVGSVLLMQFEGGEFEEIQQRIAAEPLRAEVGLNLYIVGWMLMTICVFALARLIAQRKPGLAAVAGFLALMGLALSLSFAGIAAFEQGVAQYGDRAVASEINDLVAPPVAMLALLPGIPVGWTLLAIGSWRAGVVGPARAALVAGPALVPVGAVAGFPIALVLGFVALSIVFVPLGVSLLRASRASPGARAETATPQA